MKKIIGIILMMVTVGLYILFAYNYDFNSLKLVDTGFIIFFIPLIFAAKEYFTLLILSIPSILGLYLITATSKITKKQRLFFLIVGWIIAPFVLVITIAIYALIGIIIYAYIKNMLALSNM